MSKIKKLSISLMCADLLNLERQIKIFEKLNVDYIHIDLMDAHFVPNLTFGPDFVNEIKSRSNLPLDIHMLMNDPDKIIQSLNIKENDIVTIHSECNGNIMEIISLIKNKKSKFGLALNPDTHIGKIKKYLPYIDVILLMLIIPGFPGSTMIHGIMNKVNETKKYLNENRFGNIEIEVDGSVSSERAKYMSKSGADIFVGGTKGIFIKGKNIEQTIPYFKSQIS